MNFRDIYYRDLSHGWDRFVIRWCYFPVRDSESYRWKINVVASILTGLPWVNRDSKTWTFIFSQWTTFKMNDDSWREWAKNDWKISAFINSEHNKNDIYDWRFLHNVAKTDTYVTPNYNEWYQELEYFGIKN